jgi:hypothetical protein
VPVRCLSWLPSGASASSTTFLLRHIHSFQQDLNSYICMHKVPVCSGTVILALAGLQGRVSSILRLRLRPALPGRVRVFFHHTSVHHHGQVTRRKN